ncbi:Uncharacterised protein [uncultured archaeon]|nr:Uncharacterised protein [uncultured archaeon]
MPAPREVAPGEIERVVEESGPLTNDLLKGLGGGKKKAAAAFTTVETSERLLSRMELGSGLSRRVVQELERVNPQVGRIVEGIKGDAASAHGAVAPEIIAELVDRTVAAKVINWVAEKAQEAGKKPVDYAVAELGLKRNVVVHGPSLVMERLADTVSGTIVSFPAGTAVRPADLLRRIAARPPAPKVPDAAPIDPLEGIKPIGELTVYPEAEVTPIHISLDGANVDKIGAALETATGFNEALGWGVVKKGRLQFIPVKADVHLNEYTFDTKPLEAATKGGCEAVIMFYSGLAEYTKVKSSWAAREAVASAAGPVPFCVSCLRKANDGMALAANFVFNPNVPPADVDALIARAETDVYEDFNGRLNVRSNALTARVNQIAYSGGGTDGQMTEFEAAIAERPVFVGEYVSQKFGDRACGDDTQQVVAKTTGLVRARGGEKLDVVGLNTTQLLVSVDAVRVAIYTKMFEEPHVVEPVRFGGEYVNGLPLKSGTHTVMQGIGILAGDMTVEGADIQRLVYIANSGNYLGDRVSILRPIAREVVEGGAESTNTTLIMIERNKEGLSACAAVMRTPEDDVSLRASFAVARGPVREALAAQVEYNPKTTPEEVAELYRAAAELNPSQPGVRAFQNEVANQTRLQTGREIDELLADPRLLRIHTTPMIEAVYGAYDAVEDQMNATMAECDRIAQMPSIDVSKRYGPKTKRQRASFNPEAFKANKQAELDRTRASLEVMHGVIAPINEDDATHYQLMAIAEPVYDELVASPVALRQQRTALQQRMASTLREGLGDIKSRWEAVQQREAEAAQREAAYDSGVMMVWLAVHEGVNDISLDDFMVRESDAGHLTAALGRYCFPEGQRSPWGDAVFEQGVGAVKDAVVLQCREDLIPVFETYARLNAAGWGQGHLAQADLPHFARDKVLVDYLHDVGYEEVAATRGQYAALAETMHTQLKPEYSTMERLYRQAIADLPADSKPPAALEIPSVPAREPV